MDEWIWVVWIAAVMVCVCGLCFWAGYRSGVRRVWGMLHMYACPDPSLHVSLVSHKEVERRLDVALGIDKRDRPWRDD